MKDTHVLGAAKTPNQKLRDALLLAGILLIAANLRPAITSVSPVLAMIGTGLGLGVSGLTLLATIPVACFAAGAPVSLPLQRKAGVEPAMFVALVVLCIGLGLRLIDATTPLFLGTVLAGSAIAIGNVLIPAIIKRDFPGRVGLATGLYTTVMNVTSALGAAISVPLADASGLGWRGALGFWTLPALAALLLWLPQLRHGAHRATLPRIQGSFLRLARMRLAWAVAIFMGLQSLSFYAVLSWLPVIYHSVGIGPARAGFMLSMTTVVAIPVALVTPGLATRSRDQRWLLALILGIVAIGLLGLTIAPGAAPWLWVVIIGIGLGASFPLALTLIVLRSGGVIEAVALSAFSQAIGYAISIAGPLGMGLIHAATGIWWPSTAFLLVTLIPALLFGLAAARPGAVRL